LRWKWKIQLDKNTQDFFIGENQERTYAFQFIEHTITEKHEMRFFIEKNAHVIIEFLCAQNSIDIVIEIYLRGEGASAIINGIYVADQIEKIYIRTVQHHQAPHTQSILSVRGVLYDASFVSYNGTILIEKDAHLSHASQENKNIVLSNAARVISVPTLEILTHDVRCSHASATGTFDTDQLFYAASRGITEKKAHHLLLIAFLDSLFKTEILQSLLRRMLDHE
jgi:Fe-S cluster assembly scaffold protein SufB